MKRPVCSDCLRPVKVCYCHTIVGVDNRWPVHILQHPTETKHAIGTARIVALSLTQCNLQVGESLAELSLPAELATDQSPLLVYPGEDSMPLDRLDKKITRPLIFLDASWRKSRRMLFESAELRAIPKVSFQPANVSRYRIRKEPEGYALSTLEAIAHVLSYLEQDSDKYQSLLNSMDWMIEKQIELMGRDVFEKNYQRDLKE